MLEGIIKRKYKNKNKNKRYVDNRYVKKKCLLG